MTDRPPPQAFLFWDESAFPNTSMSGYELVKAIRTFTAKMGTVKSLRFYVDIGGSKVLSPGLRSELQCSGVSIIDTVSTGRQGAASKMLLADLFTHAMDNFGICSVMIIISADSDLGYPISTLRARGEHVILICPATVDLHFLQSVDGIILEGNVFETSTPTPTPTPTPMMHNVNTPPAMSPHFQVMIDVLNNARTSQGITVYERGLLHQSLLEIRQTIFEEAGVSNFVNPMAEYINRAVALGFVRTWDNEGIQLMPAFLTGAPAASTAESPSHKSDQESAGEVALARGDEEPPSFAHSTMQARPEDHVADKISEPICEPESSPDTPLGEDQTSPLVVSVSAEASEAAPTTNDIQSLYLRCVEAVEACSNSTGLTGAAIFHGDLQSIVDLRERIRLGLYDENPQLFYADMLSIFDAAQAHYQQGTDELGAAEEMEKVFDIAFHRHFAGRIDSKEVAMASLPHSRNNQQASSSRSESSIVHTRSRSVGLDDDQALVPVPTAQLANLGASSQQTHAVWSTTDLPWPIPTHFHILVQVLNEEKAHRGISVYASQLLKTLVLMRCPRLLEANIGATGRKKNTWNMYIASAVQLGILNQLKSPRRVFLTQPFLLGWCKSSSNLPSQTSVSTNPASSGTSGPLNPARNIPGHPPPSLVQPLCSTPQAAAAYIWPSSIDIPSHFYVLIEYLRAGMMVGTIVHRQNQLQNTLLSRHPGLLVDAGLSSTRCCKSPMIHYLQAAAELRIIGMNEATNAQTLWLLPEYFTWSRPHTPPLAGPILAPNLVGSSAFPGIPAYFDVLIYYLRARCSAGLFYVRREALFQPLLKRQPDVFLQIGTTRFNPIYQYICEAEKLGIVVKRGSQVALNPTYY